MGEGRMMPPGDRPEAGAATNCSFARMGLRATRARYANGDA
jgi:hypothetical protein